jgi:hypothetical protein
MRNPIAVAVCFLVSVAAFAQQDQPNTLHLFLTNPGYVHSDVSGSRYTGAFGFAYQRMLAPHFSAEAGVLFEDYFGARLPGRTALDFTARYHFFTDGAWKPYAGLGLRQVGGNHPVDFNGGVTWQFHRSLGLRFDGKVLLGNQPEIREPISGSLGLSWRF